MSIEALKNALPEHAKDLKLNLSSLAAETLLTEQQRAGTFIAVALASLERTARTNVRDAAVIYVDAQSVVVPRRSTSRSWRSSTARRGASCAARPLSRGSRNGSPSASAPSCR